MASSTSIRFILFFLIASAALVDWMAQSSPDPENPQRDGSQEQAAKGDSVLGERIVEALAFDGALWLKGWKGLVSLDLSTGARNAVVQSGVLDMARIDGRLGVLRVAAEPEIKAIVSVWAGDKFNDVAQRVGAKGDVPFILFEAHEELGLVSDGRIRFFNRLKNSWRQVKLKGELSGGAQISAASPSQGEALYIGYNAGESGGGVQKLDIATGEVVKLQQRDENEGSQDEPMLWGDAVTDLAADPDNPRCVIASIGLVHLFMSSGRIIRI